jgi:hypothetical protein
MLSLSKHHQAISQIHRVLKTFEISVRSNLLYYIEYDLDT